MSPSVDRAGVDRIAPALSIFRFGQVLDGEKPRRQTSRAKAVLRCAQNYAGFDRRGSKFVGCRVFARFLPNWAGSISFSENNGYTPSSPQASKLDGYIYESGRSIPHGWRRRQGRKAGYSRARKLNHAPDHEFLELVD